MLLLQYRIFALIKRKLPILVVFFLSFNKIKNLPYIKFIFSFFLLCPSAVVGVSNDQSTGQLIVIITMSFAVKLQNKQRLKLHAIKNNISQIPLVFKVS